CFGSSLQAWPSDDSAMPSCVLASRLGAPPLQAMPPSLAPPNATDRHWQLVEPLPASSFRSWRAPSSTLPTGTVTADVTPDVGASADRLISPAPSPEPLMSASARPLAPSPLTLA